MSFDKNHYRGYFRDRVAELSTINHAIWGFVGAAALLDYLTQLVNEGDTGRSLYKDFASFYLGEKYTDFRYQNGKQDLHVQLYHVYRCGLLHSFCAQADEHGRPYGARDQSIVFNSLRDDGITADLNCTPYTSHGLDACRLVLEPFVADIGTAVERIFSDPGLDKSIEKSAERHPPFMYR